MTQYLLASRCTKSLYRMGTDTIVSFWLISLPAVPGAQAAGRCLSISMSLNNNFYYIYAEVFVECPSPVLHLPHDLYD